MKRTLLLAATLLNIGVLAAQDIGFSQFISNKPVLNPAYTASVPGTSIYGIGRTQWVRLPNQPFSFAKFNLTGTTEMPHGFGAGIDVGFNTQGEGYLQNWHWGLLIAKNVRMKRQAVTFGVKASYNKQQVDWSKFVFADQYDPSLGLISNTSQAIMPDELQKSYFDLDIGLLFEQKVGGYGFIEIGVNGQHLLRPDNSIQDGLIATIPIHCTGHASGSFLLTPNMQRRFWFLSPNFKADIQSNFRSFAVGTDLIFVPGAIAGNHVATSYNALFTGLYFQSRNVNPADRVNTGALSIVGGYKLKRNDSVTTFALSYDFNTGNLNHTNTKGSIEGTVTYNIDRGVAALFKTKRKSSDGKINCPDNSVGRR